MAEQNYRVRLQYLGSRYHGWQIQKDRLTVQGVLRDVLTRLAGEPVIPVGAGRTDAGVHALGQVAHFRFPVRESVPDLQGALNALLPWDIRVALLEAVSDSFHARRDARRKRYDYRIFNGPWLPPHLYGRSCHVRGRLDAEAMEKAAALLEGERDFSSFAAAGTRVRSRVRTVLHSSIQKKGRRIHYRVEGDGFLHHMVRNIAGTLIEVGLGRRQPSELPAILEARDRRKAGKTAPAEGLYLMRIWYG